jgi:hypothetical protein
MSDSVSGNVLTNKQVNLFARSKAAFQTWADEHSPDEIQMAIAEINDAVTKDEAAIDATIEMNRNQYIAKAALVKRGDEIGLQFWRRHPELTMSEPNTRLIIDRFNQILRSKGIPDQPGEVYNHVTVENFETAYRQLAEEGRIDWNQSIGSPWGHREYKHNNSEPHVPETLTEEELEQKLESGEITMEQLKELADQQLAAQNAEEIEHAVVANTDRSFQLSRVPTPEPNAPISRDRGFAADLFVPSIHLKQ